MPTIVSAGPIILDQSFLWDTFSIGGDAIIPSQHLAQTFTVGGDGTLDRVELQLWYDGSPGDLDWQLVGVDGAGLPDTGSVFTSGTVPLASIPQDAGIPDGTTLPLTTIDLSGAGIGVSVGDQFGIYLSATGTDSNWILWGAGFGTDYVGGSRHLSFDGGSTWTDFGWDFGFQTFVDVPAPASGAMAVLLGIAAVRRRR